MVNEKSNKEKENEHKQLLDKNLCQLKGMLGSIQSDNDDPNVEE